MKVFERYGRGNSMHMELAQREGCPGKEVLRACGPPQCGGRLQVRFPLSPFLWGLLFSKAQQAITNLTVT